MRFFKIIVFLLLLSSISCKSQDYNNSLFLSYAAQTRGFYFEIKLQNNMLEISKNNTSKKIELSNNQQSELNNFLSNINLSEIESNLTIQNLAVDKAIKADFNLHYNNKLYSFNLDHNNAPKSIAELISKLEEFALLEE